MSLADYLDRHGWDDDPAALAVEARSGGSPSRLRLSQPTSPRKGAASLDPLERPFAARLSHANVLFNEEYGVPVPPGSRALSPLPTASLSPNRLRSSEPLVSPMRLSDFMRSPDFLRPGEALGSPLSSPSCPRSQSVGGSSWPPQASSPMPSGVRPPRIRPSAPTGFHDSLHLPSPRASRNLSPEIGSSGSPGSGSSKETSFRKDRVTQHGVANTLSSLGLVTAAADFASKLGRSLEQKLESERRVLDTQLEKEALDWQQKQPPKPKSPWGLGVLKAAVHGSMKFKQGLAGSEEAVSPGSVRKFNQGLAGPKDSMSPGSLRAATASSEQHSSDAERATTHLSPLHSASKWDEGQRLSVALRATAALKAPFTPLPTESLAIWSELRLRQRHREVQRLHDLYVGSEQRQRSSFEDILKLYFPVSTRTELLEMESWTHKQAVVTKREYSLDELVEIRSMFDGLDTSKRGSLKLEELIAAGWGGTTDDEHADLKRMFDENDEDGDGSMDIEGFTCLVTECKLLDGDLAADPAAATTSTDVERARPGRPAEPTRRPSLAMLSSTTETVGRAEQLRLEASSAAASAQSAVS